MTAQRILLCVDGSVAALAAARLACAMAAESGGTVRAVTVLEPASVRPGRRPVDRTSEARFEGSARAMLDRVVEMGADRGVVVEPVLLAGDALRAILREARDWSPDLVAIGRTGRSGPGSPMIGSLATQVVEFAECPVVVVPPHVPEEQ